MDMSTLKIETNASEVADQFERLTAAIEACDAALSKMDGKHGGITIQIVGTVARCTIKPEVTMSGCSDKVIAAAMRRNKERGLA